MRNRIRCPKCKQVLESKHRHDFQMCDCENQTHVDGGADYTKVGGKDLGGILVVYDDGTEEPLSAVWAKKAEVKRLEIELRDLE